MKNGRKIRQKTVKLNKQKMKENREKAQLNAKEKLDKAKAKKKEYLDKVQANKDADKKSLNEKKMQEKIKEGMNWWSKEKK